MNKKLQGISIITLVVVFLFSCAKSSDEAQEKTSNDDNQQTEAVKENEKKTEDKDKQEPEEEQTEDGEWLFGEHIGEKKKLEIPQLVQENSYYCAPAAVQMILKYYGIEKEQSQLAQEINTHPVTGSEYVDVARVLNYYVFNKSEINDTESGYRVQTLMSDEDSLAFDALNKRIKDNIDNNYPIIVATNLSELYDDQPTANHILVCVGYIKKYNSEEIAFYYLIDPYNKIQDSVYGGLKIFTPKELYDAIRKNDEPAYIW